MRSGEPPGGTLKTVIAEGRRGGVPGGLGSVLQMVSQDGAQGRARVGKTQDGADAKGQVQGEGAGRRDRCRQRLDGWMWT